MLMVALSRGRRCLLLALKRALTVLLGTFGKYNHSTYLHRSQAGPLSPYHLPPSKQEGLPKWLLHQIIQLHLCPTDLHSQYEGDDHCREPQDP